MARNTMDFARQNTEQATDWIRAIAEQNLDQSRAAFEGLLKVARSAVREVDQQTAAICEHSISLADETLANTFDFAHKLVRMKEPQELIQLQSEFVSRQARLLGDQTKELGQRMVKGVQDTAKATRAAATESSRRQSEAA
ncbi:MAG TPA: phasin family protein [Xanthobacteraceae bacterium]|nr:phasin family protein [Xanthobacteraceae bacterium]